jgi:hypothetical protein
MRRLGICQKCGEEKMVRDHHSKGYSEEHKDDVAPYCESCDQKAHINARKEGRCILSSKETSKKSNKSCTRRSCKRKALSSKTQMPYIRLLERIKFNINTDTIWINSYFEANHKKKIKYIDI